MNLNPKWVFFGAVLLAIGGWIVGMPTWADLLTTKGIGGLLMTIGAILAPALMSQSIIKPKGVQ